MSAATSLPDLLAEHDIFPKKPLRPGANTKIVCPKCAGGRTKELSLSISVDEDGMGAKWRCHRGQCGWEAGGRVRTEQRDQHRTPPPRDEPRPIRKPEAHAAQPKPPALYKFFADRGIGEDTVDFFGCYVTRRRFPDPLGEQPAIVFPYAYRGETVNRKYRPPQKNPMLQERDALATLYNVDAIQGADVVWWVEGEMDVAALYEAGYRAVVSLKDGAPAELRDEDDPRRQDDKRFAALATHADELAKVARFVLAGDNDAPGAVLREELARRLGRHRCWLVTWPAGCKDAGDVLKLHGVQAVQDAVNAASPYPIEGVQRLTGTTLTKLRHSPPPPTLTTGCSATDAILHLPGEGRLIVVTGLPNAGKSTFVSFLLVHTAQAHGRKWAVFSPEMQPWEHYAGILASMFMGKPFWSVGGVPGLTDLEIEHAERWLSDRVVFLVNDAEAEPPTLDWLFERATACVLRDGVTDLLVDPWNEVEHARNGMSETEYIGRGLQRCKAFALRHGCNVWIVAHPAKMQPVRPGGQIPPPGLYDIAGCYSDDTEVLTERGWLPHEDVTLEDRVCCFDPKEERLHYLRPTAVHEYDWNGPMHHYTGYGLDMLVTPNHRMLLKAGWKRPGKRPGNERIGRPDTWKHDGWEFAESRDLQSAMYLMPLAAPLGAARGRGPEVIPGVDDQDAAWAFVGWFVAEGWVQMGAPAVCQRDESSAELRDVLARLGLPFSEKIEKPRGKGRLDMWKARLFRRGAEAFCDWIIQNCGIGAANKRLPAAVWSQSSRTKQIVFDALIAGDGHQRPHNPSRVKQGGCSYVTISHGLIGDVQRLAIELGRYAHFLTQKPAKPKHRTRYPMTIGNPERVNRTLYLKNNRREVAYHGKVRCLTVPTGAYVTRRNGRMAICGNSSHFANKSDLGIVVHCPKEMTEVHIAKARYRRYGRKGNKADLEHDPITGRYSSPTVQGRLDDPPR